MYLMNKYSKHNMNFFDKEQALTQLIDFPELHKEEK